LSKIKILKVWR